MAFCLRALLGSDCRYYWCQPPGMPPRWSPPMPAILLAWQPSGQHISSAPGRIVGGFPSPGFLIFPTVVATFPFPRRSCLPLFSRGFLLPRLIGNLTRQGNFPSTLASSQEQTILYTSLERCGPYRGPELAQAMESGRVSTAPPGPGAYW